MKEDRKRVLVVGAGISGLATAFWLKKKGYHVKVLEADSRVGGCIETRVEEGFLIELGPNSALETTPMIGELLNKLGIAGGILYANESSKKRYILRKGKLHEVPMSPWSFLRSSLFSTRGKLRLIKEPFVASGNKTDETLASFVRRRFGEEFLTYAINPFVAGVYAGDPEELSVSTAFPKLLELEKRYGSVLKGAIMGRRERKKRATMGEISKQSARLFSFYAGLSTLTEAIRKVLGGDVYLSSPVERIDSYSSSKGFHYKIKFDRGGKGFSLDADAVVISTPAYAAADLVSSYDEHLAGRLRKVPYPPVAMVFLGYRARDVERPLDGFGFLVPEVERRKILGTIWSSTLFPRRAPEGYVAFTTFVGGTRQPQLARLSEDEILEMVKEELSDLHGISSKPAYAKVKKWNRSIPQYAIGHGELLEHLQDFEARFPGIFFCANFKGGISLADCIASSAQVSSNVGGYLSES